MNDDDKFLERAIKLSRERMEANQGGPFGAVIARDEIFLDMIKPAAMHKP